MGTKWSYQAGWPTLSYCYHDRRRLNRCYHHGHRHHHDHGDQHDHGDHDQIWKSGVDEEDEKKNTVNDCQECEELAEY